MDDIARTVVVRVSRLTIEITGAEHFVKAFVRNENDRFYNESRSRQGRLLAALQI